MTSRHFYRVFCPLCREMVLECPESIIVREGGSFSVVATSRRDLVEVAGAWSYGDLPAFRAAHRCYVLGAAPGEASLVSTLCCPFCRGKVFDTGPHGKIAILPDAPPFAVTATSAEDRVEIGATREQGTPGLVTVSHVCPELASQLTPEEEAHLMARAIDLGARLAGEMFGEGERRDSAHPDKAGRGR